MLLSAQTSKRTSNSHTRQIFFAVYGIAIATVSWWLIDNLATRRLQDLNIRDTAVLPLIGIGFVALAATAALLRSPTALLAAAVMTGVGIVLGGYGSRPPLVSLPNDDLGFTLVRGASEPAVWTLGVVWATFGLSLLHAKSNTAP